MLGFMLPTIHKKGKTVGMLSCIAQMQMAMVVLQHMGMGVAIMGVGDSVGMEMPMLNYQCIRQYTIEKVL